MDQAAEIALRDEQAAQYNSDVLRYRSATGLAIQIRTTRSILKPSPTDKVLDVGCGTGLHALPLAPLVKSITAIDFSSASIDVLNESAQSNINTITCNATDWEPDDQYDKAMANKVLQHIPTREGRIAAVKTVHDALKSGGRFVCTLYRYGGFISRSQAKGAFNDAGLYRFAFEEKDVRDMIESAGLKLTYLGGLFCLPKKIRGHLPPRFFWLETALSRSAMFRHHGLFFIAVAEKE